MKIIIPLFLGLLLVGAFAYGLYAMTPGIDSAFFAVCLFVTLAVAGAKK